MSGSRGANVTRIASVAFEERLNDIATAAFYDRMLPEYEPDPVRETFSGSHKAGHDRVVDGWANLAAAVIAYSLVDYLDAFIRIRTMDIEKAYFEKNKMAEIERTLVKTGLGETAILKLKNEIKRICLGDEIWIDWELNALRRKLNQGACSVGRVTKAVKA